MCFKTVTIEALNTLLKALHMSANPVLTEETEAQRN